MPQADHGEVSTVYPLHIVRNQGVTMVRLESATRQSRNLRLQPLRKLGDWGRFVRHVAPAPCHVHAASELSGRSAAISTMQGGIVARLRSANLLHVIVRIGMADTPGEHADTGPRGPLVQAAMPTLIHFEPFTLLVAALLAMASTGLQASSTTISINVTIVEVQCTAEQRSRIRACAPAQEIVTTEPSKILVRMPSANGAPEMRYEIRLHPERPVWIKTVLY